MKGYKVLTYKTYSRLPVRSLYKIRITAITIRICMIAPRSGNAKYPTSHPIISNTIISQIKSLISVEFIGGKAGWLNK